MFVNDIFKKKQLDEGGPFSYGAKKPRKGSVADLAAQKRKEQERDKQPVEPKDHMVGVARVTKGVAEGSETHKYKVVVKGQKRSYSVWIEAKNEEVAIIRAEQYVAREHNDTAKRAAVVDMKQGVAEGSGITKLNDYDTWLDRVDALGAEKHVQKNRTLIVAQSWDGEKVGEFDTSSNQGWLMTQGVAETATRDKLYQRHQELRKKSGLPDPDYYKELKKTYDMPHEERVKQTAELKKKYNVTNEDRERYIEELERAGYEIVNERRMTCPECGGAAYSDQMLAEKQDACYHKVKSRYKVWPSAYASGALVRCRKKGAKNWGNKSKK